jgi:hypothetical protein
MTAIALKQYITNRIIDIDDDVILEKIRNLIDSNSEKVYELSDEQIILFNEAQIQYKNGDYIDDLEMDKKVEEWQKGK